MKIKLMIIAILTTILVSCDSNQGFMGDSNSVNIEGLINDHKVIVIDSCEYIVYDATKGYSGYGFMAHKGNCRFCEERRKTIDVKNIRLKLD